MKYFEKIDLPVFTGVFEEMTALLKSNTIEWSTGQICLNSTIDQPDNYKLGVGSLQYDWDKKREEVDPNGLVKQVVPFRDVIIHESEFVILCNQFKNTIFEDIYNTVNTRYKIGRSRLMKSESKTCLSWHMDPGYRLHYPVKTQEGCLMVVQDEVLHLEQNSWWIANTTVPHTAMNASKEFRIHLVFDLLHNYDRLN